MLGVPSHVYTEDPLSLIPALQNYVSRLPLNEFEQSDWVTLHSHLASYLADVLIRRHNATWKAVEDPAGALRFRYVIEAQGLDGNAHRVDPADVVMVEFRELPVEIIRMLANAELTLHLSQRIENE
jgi:hypothetical protein